MAVVNKQYPKSKTKLWEGDIDWTTDTIKVVLLKITGGGSYVYSAAHEFLSDIAGTAIIGTAETLAGKSDTDGVLDANDISGFGSPAGGSTIGALVIYKDTGVAGTSPLIFYFESVGEFPLPTNGHAVDINWSNGANKIAALLG